MRKHYVFSTTLAALIATFFIFKIPWGLQGTSAIYIFYLLINRKRANIGPMVVQFLLTWLVALIAYMLEISASSNGKFLAQIVTVLGMKFHLYEIIISGYILVHSLLISYLTGLYVTKEQKKINLVRMTRVGSYYNKYEIGLDNGFIGNPKVFWTDQEPKMKRG